MAKLSELYEKLNGTNLNESSVVARRDSAEESSVVRKVVEDIVKYIIRKEEFLTLDIPYDSDYLPNRTEPPLNNDSCPRHCCQKGCVCRSLSQKVVTNHCKKEDCIFHCICDRRFVYSLRNLPHRKTVKIMLSNSPDNSRKAKRHKRTVDEPPTMQDFPFIDLSMDDKSEIPTIEILDDENEENAELHNQRNTQPNRGSFLTTENEGRLSTVSIERNLMAFREVFVWCSMHCRYICTCQGRVFDLQKNLLQNPKTETASHKVHHFFDLEDHCSRTVGSIFNYRLRNFSRIFALKRDFEIRKGVLSNSNSCFKIDPVQPKPTSQLKIRSAPENISVNKAKNGCKTRMNHDIQPNCQHHPEEATKDTSHSPIENKIQLIFHDNSDSSDEELEDSSSLPKYGLLCLNGYGYLPIKEYNSTKLVFQHPIIKNIFVSKKDQHEANIWLNDLLKAFMSSEAQHTAHQWVVVQRGVLKISQPFNLRNLQTVSRAVN